MQLYLLRHGRAEHRAASGRDADRVLTPEGIGQLRRVLKLAHHAGVLPSLILSSPLARAIQTAEIAGQELEYPGEIGRTTSLVPESSPSLVWDEIRVHSAEPALLVVSHEPLLSSVVASLLGSPRPMMHFAAGGLARIDIDAFGAQPAGVLEWMIAPDLVP